jgi:hypothetical protein
MMLIPLFTTVSLTWVANLPPVQLMLLAFATRFNETSGSSGKFTAGVSDTSGAP